MRFRELERVPFSWVGHLENFYINKWEGPGAEASSMEELAPCIKHYRVISGNDLLWRKAKEGEAIAWGFMRRDKGNQFYPVDNPGVMVYAPKKLKG